MAAGKEERGLLDRFTLTRCYYLLEPQKSFVKRVIAMEGDEVRIAGGVVYINGPPRFRTARR